MGMMTLFLAGVADAKLGALATLQQNEPPMIQPISGDPIGEPMPAEFIPNTDYAQLKIRTEDEIQPQPPEPQNQNSNKNPINVNLSPKNVLTGWGAAAVGGSEDMGVGVGVSMPLGNINNLKLFGRGRMELLGSNFERKHNLNLGLDAILAFQINQFNVYAGPSMGVYFGQGVSFGGLIGVNDQLTNDWGWFAEGHFRTQLNEEGLAGVVPSARLGITFQFENFGLEPEQNAGQTP